MGRGRAKAKQTKVARELKYRTFETDFDQLERELHGQQRHDDSSSGEDEYDEYGGGYDDEYSPDTSSR